MVVLISSRTADMVKKLRRQAQITKEMQFLDDAYEIFMTRRDAGWEHGTNPEQLVSVAAGRCKLYSNGVGGPRFGDVIYPESPYRLRLAVAPVLAINSGDGVTPNLTNAVLVLNSARVFQIEDFKVEDAQDYLGDIYLSERPGMPKPEVQP